MKLPVAQKGFTLIELLVTLTITAIIALVTFVNIQALRQDQVLQSAAEDLQSNLRLVYTNAVANIQCPNGNQSIGWQTVFSNISGNQEMDINCLYDGGSITAKKIPFNNVTLSKIYSNESSQCTVDLTIPSTNVTFDFSLLTGFINWDTAAIPSIVGCFPSTQQDIYSFDITSQVNNQTKTKTVSINQGGSISNPTPSP